MKTQQPVQFSLPSYAADFIKFCARQPGVASFTEAANILQDRAKDTLSTHELFLLWLDETFKRDVLNKQSMFVHSRN